MSLLTLPLRLVNPKISGVFVKRSALSVSIAAMTFLAACGGGGGGGSNAPDDNDDSGQDITISVENVSKVLQTNADIALAIYSDAYDTAVDLHDALDSFALDPSQDNLNAAKIAWLVSREPYGQSEVYRFRLSPIDSSNYADEDGLEGDINAWPLGEALIDYVVEGNDFGADQLDVTDHGTLVNFPDENIINSDVVIDADLISNTATADDEHDVIAGYHAIEFMLWGQDLNEDLSADTQGLRELSSSGNVLNSGGHRPITDFTTAENADRRLLFLQVVADKLVADLATVRDGWIDGASYREAFTTITNESEARQKLGEILTGMGTLSEGELAGERMQISFSTGSQEDEHSCFSDNTHRDIWLNAEGVSNSYYGDYSGYDSTLDGTDDVVARAVSGYGIDDLLADLNVTEVTAIGADLAAALSTTEDNYKEIDTSARAGTPVDVLIEDASRNSDNPMYTTILSLNVQSGLIGQLAEALEIEASVVDDEASSCDTQTPTELCEE